MKLLLPVCLLLVASAVRAGGPPFVSIEAPVDPLDSRAKGAVMLVHVHSCGEATDTAVTGRAEGMVEGRRESIVLDLRPTSDKGVYAVKPDWPRKGTWVLAFTTTQHVPATTLVELGPDGGITMGSHYSRDVALLVPRSFRVLDHVPTERDLASSFRTAPALVSQR